jgi:uncharacterized hydrophobic protein (TIGR00271 family)
MRSVSLIFVIYAAIEALLAARRQVRDPVRSLTRGLVTILLIGGLILITVQLVVAGFQGLDSYSDPTYLALGLNRSGPFPLWAIAGVASILLILAANATLMTAARELNALSRQGALPGFLRRLSPPFRVQPYLFLFIAVLALPSIFLVPTRWLLDLAAGTFVVTVLILNLAAIRSRIAEPERRRPFEIPFFPLVPAMAMAITVIVLFGLPIPGILGGLVWFGVGLVIYLTYSHTHLMEAQEGVLVFGREAERERREGAYRILVPIGAGVERHFLLGLATALARQTDGEVIPLQVISIADPLAITEGRRVARERNTLFKWSTRVASKRGVPTFPITRLARSVAAGILDTADEEDCDLILMSWALQATQQGTRMGSVLDPVVRRAPCDVAVVAVHPDRLHEIEDSLIAKDEGEGVREQEDKPLLRMDRLLVTTAGGPHAPLATRLALLLAREYGATTETVYVAGKDASPEDLSKGQKLIQQTLTTMREQLEGLPLVEAEPKTLQPVAMESRVVASRSVVDGIAQAGAESDLVFVGASEESLIDQVLFGTVPEQVAWACPSPVVMVKRFRGLRRFWLQRVWDALFGTLPTLERQERVEVYSEVRRGARPDVDYFVMVGLSAIIATYGLLQGSTAVIIGAMLVAPLFTPILALSLAIVQGDIRLLRIAIEAALKGIALAVGLAVFLTALSPLRSITHEIASRTQPNLFDLAVALASGAAGAYAVARKDVATALPGVAIAAALVPPLGVVGIGFAMGDPGIAWGSSLLFVTNLIAITLAGAVTLILLGFRPTARAEREARLRMGLVASLVLLVAIAIPLGVVFVRSVQDSRVRQIIDQMITAQLADHADYELVDFDFETDEDTLTVRVTIYAQSQVPPTLVDSTRDRLSQALSREVRLQLRSILVEEIESQEP